ncbi:hypothetical protein XELAEV_18005541mg [Xenopus laevis]|uniref:GIY-YIG domain-containing protein n=1 Tax=Xenopus laevis TaxID=8355 RepID=A0A974DYC8_XENLA|nr:hypothetical protein XELAEV_18005541mg [Xenopus laevis]
MLLWDRFIQRGYDFWDVKLAYDRAVGTSRSDLLASQSMKIVQAGSNKNSKRHGRNRNECPRIITSYSRNSARLRGIVQKYWNVLGQDPSLRDFLPSQPNFAFKRGPCLGSILSPSLFSESESSGPTHWLTVKGCYRCGVSRCGTCRYMKPSKTFSGRLNRRIYNINFYANCGTCNIVYLITCYCGLQYVGKTIRPLRKRVSEHLGSVTRGDCSSAVSKHLIERHDSKA